MIRKFKNDKERIAFLQDRNPEDGWYIWKHDPDLDRVWWRYDLESCAFVVETQRLTYRYPEEHIGTAVIHWYIIDDWDGLFADQQASRSLALARLKQEEKL